MTSVDELRSLSEKDLLIFNAEFERRRKSTLITYLLWFFVGSLGVHKFYLGQVAFGILYLVLGAVAWFFFFGGALMAGAGETDAAEAGALGLMIMAWGASGLVGLFLLIDLFTIPMQVSGRENRIKRELATELRTS